MEIFDTDGLLFDEKSYAHGVPVTEIHFHKVGTMDAVADIMAVCLLMDRLAPYEVAVPPFTWAAGRSGVPMAFCQSLLLLLHTS